MEHEWINVSRGVGWRIQCRDVVLLVLVVLAGADVDVDATADVVDRKSLMYHLYYFYSAMQ